MRQVNLCEMRRRSSRVMLLAFVWRRGDWVRGSNGSKPRINADQPMRQRIVINLDEPKTVGAKTARKRRRWPRVLAILALLVLVIVVAAAAGGFFWWRH